MPRNNRSTERVLAIYRDGFLVAVLRPVPGSVRSSVRGRGDAVRGACVSGESRGIEEEEALAALISGAASAEELAAALAREGYEVKPTPASVV